MRSVIAGIVRRECVSIVEPLLAQPSCMCDVRTLAPSAQCGWFEGHAYGRTDFFQKLVLRPLGRKDASPMAYENLRVTHFLLRRDIGSVAMLRF